MITERYNRKDAEKAFERLCGALGKRIATSYNDIGAWSLDYNGVYGGFVIEEPMNSGGGVNQPFGHTRRNAREFCDVVWFTLRSLEMLAIPKQAVR